MKKIPTLFKRVFDNHKIVDITPEITPGCEEAFYNGNATTKIDGSCCAIIDGVFYKRYDAKKGKRPPEGAIPCCDPDPITGHHPHWVKVDENNPADKWFVDAYKNGMHRYDTSCLNDGTYEAVGPHFQGNPYQYPYDTMIRHGDISINVARDFESIRSYLKKNCIEGIVFWLDGEPVCKIKRSDFGFRWP
jgi:hypothetical protein